MLPYLVDPDPWTLDLALEVRLNGELVSQPPFATMYWSPGQQLAHLTVNGASLRTGDVYASGTVSGPEVGQRGSFLELSWGGRDPLVLAVRPPRHVPRGRRPRHPLRLGHRCGRRPHRPRRSHRPDPSRPLGCPACGWRSIGGSIAGLTAGLALSRQGHQVTVLERDAQPLPASPEAAASQWRRGGVPQVRQSHGFISRARSELLQHAPDLWQRLVDVGAIELRLLDRRRETLDGFEPLVTDDELAFLLCRRTTFEWVLRREAERECDVRLGTRVTGLLTDDSGARPRATGVGDG